MRKYIRYMIRKKAEDMGVKPSRFVKKEFDRMQIKIYGRRVRKLNQARGTHKFSAWKNREIFALCQ